MSVGAKQADQKLKTSLSERSIDELCINTIRTLSMDAVQQAESGHPGTPMALAPVIYTLWQRFPAFRSRESDLAESRPLCAVQRPCLDAALCDAASHRRKGAQCRARAPRRARGHARRHQALPSDRQQLPRTSRIPPDDGRRDDNRPAGSGLRDERRHGDRGALVGANISIGRTSRCSTTTFTRCVVMAT